MGAHLLGEPLPTPPVSDMNGSRGIITLEGSKIHLGLKTRVPRFLKAYDKDSDAQPQLRFDQTLVFGDRSGGSSHRGQRSGTFGR